MIRIVKAKSPAQFAEAGRLILEYQSYIDSMRFHECIAGDIMHEIRQLDEAYPAKDGGVFLAYEENMPLGCVAMERQAEGIAEIRRLYVSPEGRGRGIGKQLIQSAVEEAKKLGYKRVRLDTFRAVDFAASIYRESGFTEIPPYSNLPSDKVVFMEQAL